MFAQNYIFFYGLSFLLLITSFLMLILPRFSQMITASALFFLCISGLYLGFNSAYLFIIQTTLCVIATVLLLIFGFKITSETERKKSSYSNARIIFGFLFLLITFGIIGMFIYYFKTATTDNGMLIFSIKNEFSAVISFFLTAKTVVFDYCLAYGLIIMAFITSLTGIYVLIPKNKQLTENERNKE